MYMLLDHTVIVLFLQDYFQIIRNPIDLSAIDAKLSNGEYATPWQV